MNSEIPYLSNATDRCVAFEENIRKLFTVCGNIKNIIQSKKNITKKNMIYDSFNQFVNTYDDIGAEDTMIIFEDFYIKKRYQILSRKDSWLGENTKATIEFPSKKSKRKKAIFLSIYYRNAQDISREAEREVTEYGREEEADNVYLPEELIFPLLEIFSLVAPSEDLEKLNLYREEIKSELPSTDITPNTTNPLGAMGGMGGLGGLLNGALGGIDFSNLQKSFGNLTENSGGSGEGASPMIPEGLDIGETISGIFNNPESKKVINTVTGRFQNIKDMNDLQGVVGGLLADKDLQDSVKNLVPEPITDREANKMVSDAKKECPDKSFEENLPVIIDEEPLIKMSGSEENFLPSETTVISNTDIIQEPSVLDLDVPRPNTDVENGTQEITLNIEKTAINTETSKIEIDNL